MRKLSSWLLIAALCVAVSGVASRAQIVQRVVDQVIATACTNQFVRSIAASGSATCNSVAIGSDVSGLGTNQTTFLAANLTTNGALKLNGSGTPSQAACADLSNGSGACAQTYTATTWTPVVTTDATVGTPAYTRQTGTYEQIGRQVTVRFDIILSGWTGSPTGNVSLSGLPVAAATDRGFCFVSVWATSTALIGVWGDVSPGASTIRLLSTTVAATAQGLLSAAQAGTTFNVAGFCSYHI